MKKAGGLEGAWEIVRKQGTGWDNEVRSEGRQEPKGAGTGRPCRFAPGQGSIIPGTGP